jgi:hypothetical protein
MQISAQDTWPRSWTTFGWGWARRATARAEVNAHYAAIAIPVSVAVSLRSAVSRLEHGHCGHAAFRLVRRANSCPLP